MKKHSLAQTQAWAKENDLRQFMRFDPKERKNNFKKDYGNRRKPNFRPR
jgi:hypothetical protein|tara:strand:- start:1432 stop:1578 length:147 start_codon:yes stop_codon:yes gene_type:complete